MRRPFRSLITPLFPSVGFLQRGRLLVVSDIYFLIGKYNYTSAAKSKNRSKPIFAATGVHSFLTSLDRAYLSLSVCEYGGGGRENGAQTAACCCCKATQRPHGLKCGISREPASELFWGLRISSIFSRKDQDYKNLLLINDGRNQNKTKKYCRYGWTNL